MRNEREIQSIHLEICASSLESVLIADKAEASRVELCQDLELGGTTPSYGLIKSVLKETSLGVHVLVRPRSGDFVYSESEIRVIEEDIVMCRELGCSGVVVGALNPDGRVNTLLMRRWIELASPMQVVFHRAFDRANDPLEALETIIELGCDRILTSGQQENAWLGKDLLRTMVQQAGDRIEVMPGAGVNCENIRELLEYTGAKSIHASAKKLQDSNMTFHNPAFSAMNESVPVSSEKEIERLVQEILKVRVL